MPRFFSWFHRHQDWGIFLLRLFIGLRLIYGVMDNVISWEHMLSFSTFLEKFNFPVPLVSAITSVYLQLLAGMMIVVGLYTRYAALIMIVNFAIALVTVHRHDTVEGMTPALAIMFCCLLFLFQGAGRIAIDEKRLR